MSKIHIENLLVDYQSRFIEMFGDPVKNKMGWNCDILENLSQSRLGKMLDVKKNIEGNSFSYLANYNIKWFNIEISNLNKMSFNEKEIKEFSLKKGDLLVCEGGEIGRCAIWNNEINEVFFQKALHRIRCIFDKLNPIFLSYVFYFMSKNHYFEKYIGSKATIPHLTGIKLKNLRTITPPIELQNEFALFIEQLDKSKFGGEKVIYLLEKIQYFFV